MDLKERAKQLRMDTMRCIGSIGTGHIGGCLSIIEVLTLLYFKHMNVDPQDPRKPDRDRLVLSKGHAGPALYAALAGKGYFDRDVLLTLNRGGTTLPSHCDMNKTPGVDMTAGSLGQGFSCAMGLAKASKLVGDGATIYSIIGDGESQEGQIWEAAMWGAQQKLDNVIAFTDYNKMQIDGTIEEINDLAPLDAKWASFGWDVQVVDGHDLDAIDQAIVNAKNKAGKPHMIILNTIKGKGVALAEGKGVGSHSFTVTPEEVETALEEIRRA
ncbi:MAG: transketolase [Clostridia bacterium]|nr:transketolase [Clostridia bacterium]